jgi:hypothetical protein
MKPDEAMDLLREAHREPIPEAHFAAVRARVLSQIAAERGVSRRWVWSYGFAVVAAVGLLLAFWPKQPVRRHVVTETRSPVIKPLANTRAPVASPEPVRAVVAARSPTHRRPPVSGVIGPPNPTPMVVKMFTEDPDVVIYWISERTGE